jgi:PAS domain S-box-containing protein
MNKPRILIVEDEVVVAIDVESRLRALGFEVTGRVATGAAGIQEACERRPDLVLMDIRLKGGMDGIEAANEIRTRTGLPVVFLTAHADDRTVERAKLSEPFGYLLKPFQDRELKTAIEIALYRQRTESEIRRLGMLYAVLSRVNRALVGARTIPAFLEEVCRAGVEEGHFIRCRVGRVETGGAALVGLASWGGPPCADRRLPEPAQGTEAQAGGGGPVGCPCVTAFSSGKPWVGRPPAEEGREGSCTLALGECGVREMAVVPVVAEGGTWGVFAVSSDRRDAFGPREVELLLEVGAAIGFGVEHLQREAERERAEQETREQRRMFETLLEVMPAPVFVEDLQGNYQRCNEAFARFLGLPKERILGRPVAEVVTRQWADRYQRADEAILREGRGTACRYTSEVVSAGGATRDVVFHKTLLRDSAGTPGGIMGVMLDITDLREREREIAASERRFRALIENSGDSIAVIDREGRILYSSVLRGSWQVQGRGQAERDFVGEQFFSLLHPDDVERVRLRFDSLIAMDVETMSTTYRFRHLDGTWRWTEATGTNRLQDPEIHGVVINYREITQRVLAEQELRHREAELTAIYNNAPFMMCLVNRAGSIVRHNRALAALAATLGYPLADPMPADFIRCLTGLDASVGSVASGGAGAAGGCGAVACAGGCALREAVRDAFASGTACQQVESRLALAGRDRQPEVYVSAAASRIDLGGEPLVLLCLEDITNRRRLEAQFLQAQKMEAVGQLAGGIAHDFNNILAAMLMNLGLMRNPGRYDGDPYDALTELERLAQRAADLTRQLLLFGRRQVLQASRIDLNSVIGGLFRMLRRLLGDHIEVRLACGSDPMWIDADPGMIEQVIVNLVLNARDAMPGGGRLVIGAERLQVTEGGSSEHPDRRPGWYVRLRVVDSGTGMEPAVLARIFEPFFTTKETGRGTGLGLPTVQGIVEQHRGWIAVESEVGKGTAFWVYLPAAAGPPAREGAARRVDAPSSGGSETVLLVEDAPAVRRMVAMTLRSLGYRVVEASDGDEALDRWNRNPSAIDVVLTDMVMPGGLSGLELIERLRLARPDLKAVISSGYSLDLIRQGNPLLRRVVYLPKPYQSDGLAKALRECLDGGGGHFTGGA